MVKAETIVMLACKMVFGFAILWGECPEKRDGAKRNRAFPHCGAEGCESRVMLACKRVFVFIGVWGECPEKRDGAKRK